MVILREVRSLVAFGTGHFFPIVIQHCHIPPIVRAAQRHYLVFPVPFFTHKLVNLVIKIPNLIVGQAG